MAKKAGRPLCMALGVKKPLVQDSSRQLQIRSQLGPKVQLSYQCIVYAYLQVIAEFSKSD